METACRANSAITGLKLGYASKGIHTMIERARHFIGRLGETDCDMPDTWSDPLSHPAIRAMSARELADLPFASKRLKQ